MSVNATRTEGAWERKIGKNTVRRMVSPAWDLEVKYLFYNTDAGVPEIFSYKGHSGEQHCLRYIFRFYVHF